ncbi:MAG: CopD family protein [Pseudomonadota bacterium]|nr:CopD family protein [Pseudomonadota bacterium]
MIGFDMPLAQHGATVLLNLALAIAIGAGATMLWTTQTTSVWARSRVRTVRHVGLVALAVALSASAGVLWLEAAAMAEVPLAQAAEAARSMLTSTHLGLAWKIGTGALLLGIAAMALATPGRRTPMLVALAAVAGFLYTRSMVSHASAAGDFNLQMVIDWIHLILVCLWVGEVIVSGLVVLSSSPGALLQDRSDCARYVESLSTSATFALAGIFATGLFNAWLNLGGASVLVSHPYGTTLLIKLTLVMGAVLLGGANRFIVMPGLIASLRSGDAAADRAMRQFTLILRVEAVVLVGVLFMAAILSSTSPPTAG